MLSLGNSSSSSPATGSSGSVAGFLAQMPLENEMVGAEPAAPFDALLDIFSVAPLAASSSSSAAQPGESSTVRSIDGENASLLTGEEIIEDSRSEVPAVSDGSEATQSQPSTLSSSYALAGLFVGSTHPLLQDKNAVFELGHEITPTTAQTSDNQTSLEIQSHSQRVVQETTRMASFARNEESMSPVVSDLPASFAYQDEGRPHNFPQSSVLATDLREDSQVADTPLSEAHHFTEGNGAHSEGLALPRSANDLHAFKAYPSVHRQMGATATVTAQPIFSPEDDPPLASTPPAQFAASTNSQDPAIIGQQQANENNISQPVDRKRIFNNANNIGIESAKAESRMSAEALSAPSVHPDPIIPVSMAGASPTTAADGARTARAVEIVQQVSELSATLGEQAETGTVSVNLDFGEDGPLTVQVSLKDGFVHTVFRSDSRDVQESLTSAWRHYSTHADKTAAALMDPVFLPLRAISNASPGNLGQQQQQQNTSQEFLFHDHAGAQTNDNRDQRRSQAGSHTRVRQIGNVSSQQAPASNPVEATDTITTSSRTERHGAHHLAAIA